MLSANTQSNRTVCNNYSIVQDSVVENDETFLAIFNTPDSAIILERNNATVTITDTSSMYSKKKEKILVQKNCNIFLYVVSLALPVLIKDGTPEQVVEGSQINLCIVHEGRLDRDVVVILIVQSSTASGKKVCWCLKVDCV